METKNLTSCIDHSERTKLAHQLHREGTLLLAGPTDRAFETGKIFKQIRDEGLVEALGCKDFQEYLKTNGLKRSTVYSNIQLVEIFDVQAHGHVGISKLRLLVKLKNPLLLIEDGVVIFDQQGNAQKVDIMKLSYRDCVKVLKGYEKVFHDDKGRSNHPEHEEIENAVEGMFPPSKLQSDDDLTSLSVIPEPSFEAGENHVCSDDAPVKVESIEVSDKTRNPDLPLARAKTKGPGSSLQGQLPLFENDPPDGMERAPEASEVLAVANQLVSDLKGPEEA